jgi:LmbE family N-acetylglucosaminyl deacetylase
VWVMAAVPNHHVDITDHIDRKLAALRAHASQHSDPSAMEERVRGWNAGNAAGVGLAEGRYAELFLVVGTA